MGHAPLHAAVPKPATAPYSPTTQLLHDDDPATLYCPAGHTLAVAFVDPAGHAYPAGHTPLHAAVVRPELLPYTPAGHCPLHDALVLPDVDPYHPALQLLHDDDPPAAYCPAGQIIAVEDTDPDGHMYPALHGPLHCDDVRPVPEPYRPGSHGPLQLELVSPDELP